MDVLNGKWKIAIIGSLTFGEKSAPEGGVDHAFDGDIVFYPNWYGTGRLSQWPIPSPSAAR